ncbi:GTPase family protein [Aphanizomenon flos-aquae NRERC-008]|jgi:small GTP-binding protein|uniref:GTPase family protein n=1 Tax=Aphanizomenon flos-aquae FACHB-1249 TaxID=2692889 RepID=A0ABR8IQ50_APHFL|nr:MULTISPECIES: GTPase family protein [Aphanizomenon]MDJ0504761.1 GTPase family protein [Nostocales cyanobacterium LE14-WE12]MBD2391039.1 GTPase family protein [Aphanizomenon flos-aquae FACHB-1171]MBD2556856.1 GTPase family protein [Aphanizomenon flos-aquae FACHB-1290]MBD2630781.1 GTPase family protein [Aphanizomenon sp. FACHB-1399]MBD2641764.1 GTPase family protein [Aphanizomenon sp. FACHB-1401]
MIRLKLWQWMILVSPIVIIISFLIVAAGTQIHTWGLSWIWALFTFIFVGWRWLLVRWTKPAINQMEAVFAEVREELETSTDNNLLIGTDTTKAVQTALQDILIRSANDLPIWEDWQTFWQRCQELIVVISHIYNPEVKYPLLNIYIPQVYGLIRGTVDDMDQWMQKLSPVLNQVTVGQAYQTYEVYRKLEPSARKLWKVWNWAQWVLNPITAVAKKASEGVGNRASQELLINLSQLLREAALRNLCKQAIALYTDTKIELPIPTLPQVKTQTLRDILSQSEPLETVAQKPINILIIGRTGAGKSSLINTLFQDELAAVDVLPSTDTIQNYHWETENGEILNLWDTPGYEQVKREDLRDLVIDYASNADLLLLVTPALDPALQMDVDFLEDVKLEVEDLPIIAIVTQVDRLRPIREWQPPYNWEKGEKPKEISIREATKYRQQLLGNFANLVLPIVTNDPQNNRNNWNIEALSSGLLAAIEPAKQLRLTRFLRNLETRTTAAARIIDHYTFQMTTTQGITAILKSPVLQFISTLSTGSPTLAYLLAEQIPIEKLPIVIGKLQMAYELFPLLNIDNSKTRNFDLLSLWPLLLENSSTPDRNAWAFGHALIEYWTQDLTIEQLRTRFNYYLQQ